MRFVQNFLIIFVSAYTFCADGTEDPCCSKDLQQKYELRPLEDPPSTKILAFLWHNQDQGFSYEDLMQKGKLLPGQKKRQLFQAILDLRASGWCIEHNCSCRQFKLCAGKWQTRSEDFKLALWEKISADESLLKTENTTLALCLSDQKYSVTLAGVDAVKTLWRIMFGGHYESLSFLQRQRAWSVVLRDNRVYSKAYYARHPDVPVPLQVSDLLCLKLCLELYNNFVEFRDPKALKITNDLYSYISQCPNGVSLQDLERFVSTKTKDWDVWTCVRFLMRSNYGLHVVHMSGRFFVTKDPQGRMPSPGGLLANLCALYQESPSSQYITVGLYRRGFCTVNAFDVDNIVDVLISAGRLLCLDFCYQSGMLRRDAPERWMSCLQKLRTQGALGKIARNQEVDIVQILKEDVSPEHAQAGHLWEKDYAMCEESFAQEGSCAQKRHCVGAGVLAMPEVPVQERCEPYGVQGGSPQQSLGLGDIDINIQALQDSNLVEWMDSVLAQLNDNLPGLSYAPEGLLTSTIESVNAGPLTEGLLPSPAPLGDVGVPQEVEESCAMQAMRRRNHILYALQNHGERCFPAEELQRLCGDAARPETLLEDVVDLIHYGHNIEYCAAQYRWRSEEFPSANVPNQDSGWDDFYDLSQEASFFSLTVGEKAYKFYEKGYRHVPLSTVALFVGFAKTSTTGFFGKRFRRILALKDKILQDEEIKPTYAYRDDFPGHGAVVSEDIKCVKNSLLLYKYGLDLQGKVMNAGIKKRTVNKTGGIFLHSEVLDYLRLHKNQPCSEEALAQVIVTPVGHRRRDLYRAVVHFRDGGENVVHDKNAGTLTLTDGYFKKKSGSYQRVLWHMLHKPGAANLNTTDALIALSDLGYIPSGSHVDNIFLLKRLCDREGYVDSSRQALWNIVVQEGYFGNADYYRNRADFRFCVTDTDMSSIQICWALYNHIMYDQKPAIAEKLKRFLRGKPEGVSCTRLKEFLFNAGAPCVWSALSGLMRRGYAGNIIYNRGVCLWQENGPKITPKDKGLFESLCLVPLDYHYGFATLFLHHRGHLNVCPWDVQQWLDILAFCQRRDPDHNSRAQKVWQDAQQGLVEPSKLQHKDFVLLRRIRWLERIGVIGCIMEKTSVHIEPLLTQEEWICEGEGYYGMHPS